MSIAGMTKAWTEAEAAKPLGWEIRGVAKGPRQADPEIRSAEWCAWARPSPEAQRADAPPVVEGRGETPYDALNALARQLDELRAELSGRS